MQAPNRNGIRAGADNVTVTGNTVRDVATNPGIVIVGENDDSVTIFRAAVSDNVIRNVGNDAIRLLNTQRGTINGDTMRDIAGDAISGDDGAVSPSAVRVAVIGNVVTVPAAGAAHVEHLRPLGARVETSSTPAPSAPSA